MSSPDADDGIVQGDASGGGGQWMRIFVPDVEEQGALLHLGKAGPNGTGHKGASLQAHHDVVLVAGNHGEFKTGGQLVMHSNGVMNQISLNDYNALSQGHMSLGAVGGLVISSIGAAGALPTDDITDGGELPLPDAPQHFIRKRNEVYNTIRNAQNFTTAFAGTVMGVKALLGFSWEPSWAGLSKFVQVCGAINAVASTASGWVKYAKGANTVVPASAPASGGAAGGGAGGGGAGGGGGASGGGAAGGSPSFGAAYTLDKAAKPVGAAATLAGKTGGKWVSGEVGLGGRQGMRDAGVSDADVAARLKTQTVTPEEISDARTRLTRLEIAQQIPTDAEVAAANGDYREAQKRKAAEVRARDERMRTNASNTSSTSGTQITDLNAEEQRNNARITQLNDRPMEEGPQGLGAAPMTDDEAQEMQRLRQRNIEIEEERAAAQRAKTQADAESAAHTSRDRADTWKRAGAVLEAGGAAVGAVLAVKGFNDALKTKPKSAIPGVATVSDDEIFMGTIKGITGVAGDGVTFVVPSVLSGFSVVSGGAVSFQSALKSEIFSVQSVTVEGGLGADLVASGPVQVMSRMRDTSVMGREIKIGAQAGDIATFAGKINTFMMKGWNPAKQRPTMEVTIKAEKAGKIQIQIDTKKRVFIEPSKITVEFMGNSIVMSENEVKVVAADKLNLKCKKMEIDASESFKLTSPKVEIAASTSAKIETGGSTIKTSSASVDVNATTVTVNGEKLT